MPGLVSSNNPQTVVRCYTVFDKFFPVCGMLDYTEGLYHDDPTTTYDAAQLNQIRYVLDQVQCGPGTRVIDIGCGNGTLLEEVRRRDAIGVGITISPEQVRLCRHKGLDVHLLNYRDLPPEWSGRFDAVIANGPVEHFVQPEDAVAGRADAIYEEMFAIFFRLIDPRSPIRRAINTTIHFVRPPDPHDLLQPYTSFPRGSDGFHYALLAQSFGGFYPVAGQLERAAAGRFRLIHQTDGTCDYHLTSEHWLRAIRHELSPLRKGWRIITGALPVALRYPRQFVTMLRCMLITESWNWQFRPPNPPTRLLRQTWTYLPTA